MAAFTIFAIGSAVSAGLSAWQAHQAGNAETRAGEAERDAAFSQADLADVNAAQADLQAQDALSRGELEVARYDEGVRGVLGAQTAAFAGGNIDVHWGSPDAVARDTRRLAELDELTIRSNASREALGYRTEASDLRARAGIARKTGRFAAAAGRARGAASTLAGVNTILSTGSSLVEAKYGYTWRH